MLPCALTHTHTHNTHTYHGQSVIHTSMLCYCNFLIVDPHTLAVILSSLVSKFVFQFEPSFFLNCLVFQCAHLCMHTCTPHTSAYTCNCCHMFIFCVNSLLWQFYYPLPTGLLLPFALLDILMHMHTHTCTHTCTHPHAHAHTHAHTHMHMHTPICTCTHTGVVIQSQTYVHMHK